MPLYSGGLCEAEMTMPPSQLAHEQRDGGRRDDAGQEGRAAHRHDAGGHGGFQHVAGQARILADEDGGALERHGGLAQLEGRLARQLLVRHTANPMRCK